MQQRRLRQQLPMSFASERPTSLTTMKTTTCLRLVDRSRSRHRHDLWLACANDSSSSHHRHRRRWCRLSSALASTTMRITPTIGNATITAMLVLRAMTMMAEMQKNTIDQSVDVERSTMSAITTAIENDGDNASPRSAEISIAATRRRSSPRSRRWHSHLIDHEIQETRCIPSPMQTSLIGNRKSCTRSCFDACSSIEESVLITIITGNLQSVGADQRGTTASYTRAVPMGYCRRPQQHGVRLVVSRRRAGVSTAEATGCSRPAWRATAVEQEGRLLRRGADQVVEQRVAILCARVRMDAGRQGPQEVR